MFLRWEGELGRWRRTVWCGPLALWGGDADGDHRIAVKEGSCGFQATEPNAPRYSVLRSNTGTASPTSDPSSSPDVPVSRCDT